MNAQNQTENLTIHHKVKDYAAWRKGYDAMRRPAMGRASQMAEYSEAQKIRMMS